MILLLLLLLLLLLREPGRPDRRELRRCLRLVAERAVLLLARLLIVRLPETRSPLEEHLLAEELVLLVAAVVVVAAAMLDLRVSRRTSSCLKERMS